MNISMQQNYRKQNNSFGATLFLSKKPSFKLPITPRQIAKLSGIIRPVETVDSVHIGAFTENGKVRSVWTGRDNFQGADQVVPLPKGVSVFEHCKRLLQKYIEPVATS